MPDFLDRMLYLVICGHRNGPYVPETSLDHMSCVNVTKDIIAGQYEQILHVIEWNPVENICREVTHEFAEVIINRGADDL